MPNIVLTVEASLEIDKSIIYDSKGDTNDELVLLPERFMAKGGGFIYSTSHNN